MIDIDDFKQINDNYGHQQGDQLLIRVATSIGESLRQSDIVGRYGGEEFVVFLPDVNPDYLTEIAEKIRSGVETITLKKRRITVSIGISAGSFDRRPVETRIEKYLQKADFNLYQAKKLGKNRVVG
jgi:diguanylate cyclase (GGDEF)-like protein